MGKKLLIKLQNSQEIHHRMVQKQLKIKQKALDLIEKYQKKDIADKITKLSRVHHRIIQKQLKVKQKIMDLIEKYKKKDI